MSKHKPVCVTSPFNPLCHCHVPGLHIIMHLKNLICLLSITSGSGFPESLLKSTMAAGSIQVRKGVLPCNYYDKNDEFLVYFCLFAFIVIWYWRETGSQPVSPWSPACWWINSAPWAKQLMTAKLLHLNEITTMTCSSLYVLCWGGFGGNYLQSNYCRSEVESQST